MTAAVHDTMLPSIEPAEGAAIVPAAVRFRVAFAGRVLSLDAADRDAVRVLCATYAPLEDAGARRAHHAATLRAMADGRLHARFDGFSLAAGERTRGPGLLPAYYALKEIFARFAAGVPGGLALYGSLVAIDDVAVLLLGPAGSGKTLVALELARRGARFLGDETVLLDLRTGRARALPRRPAMRESALPLLASDLREKIDASPYVTSGSNGKFWYALDSTALGGIEPDGRDLPLRAAVLLHECGDAPTLHSIDGEETVRALLHRAYARPFELRELAEIKRIVRRASCYRAVYAHPAQTADSILQNLRPCV